jgi:hypothetical protein
MLLDAPELLPMFTVVLSMQSDDTVRRKRSGCCRFFTEQQCEQPRQVWKVAGDQDIPRFVAQPIAEPQRRIIRLEIPGRGKAGKSITFTPEGLGRLPRPQLATVPDDFRAGAMRRGGPGEPIDRVTTDGGQRAPGVDAGWQRVAMMNDVDVHAWHPMSSMLQTGSDERKGIGGWLQVLVRMLTLWHPIIYGLSSSAAIGAVSVRGPAVAIVIVARLAVVAYGIAAGMALRSTHNAAVRLAMTSLALSAAMDLFIYTTSYYPSNRMPGETPLYVVATLAYYAAWLLYLARSKRVRNTFA